MSVSGLKKLIVGSEGVEQASEDVNPMTRLGYGVVVVCVLGFFVYPGIVPGVLASRAGVFSAFHVQTAYGFGRLARTAKQHRGQNTQQGVTHIQHMNRNLRLPGCLYYAGLYKNNLCLA
jgi:hypothetical protein